MRPFLTAAALVAIPTISLATSQADGKSRQRYNDFYYGRYDTAFAPVLCDQDRPQDGCGRQPGRRDNPDLPLSQGIWHAMKPCASAGRA